MSRSKEFRYLPAVPLESALEFRHFCNLTCDHARRPSDHHDHKRDPEGPCRTRAPVFATW